MKFYLVKTITSETGSDNEGNPIVIAAGAVVNRIVWDGITPYNPGVNRVLLLDSQQ